MESSETKPAHSSEQYRGFPDVVRFPVGEGREVVYSPVTRAGRLLAPQMVRLLMDCGQLATLDEHVARLCAEQGLRPDQADVARRLLQEFVAAGLMMSRRELTARCGKPSREAVPPIAWLGIPTRNRPCDLERCVVSYVEAARRADRATSLVVIDDSDPETRQRNAAFLAMLAAREAVPVAYAGPEEKAAFAAKLAARAGVPAEVAEFALLNPERCSIATGASRNALLLHGVGDLILQVDDDTRGQLHGVPQSAAGFALTSQYDPTQFWFPTEPQRDRVPAVVPGPDLATIHEVLLGKSLANCLAEAGADACIDVDRTNGRFYRKIEQGGGRIAATMAGVAGNSGMGSSAYLLTLDGPSRARLLAAPECYEKAMRGHDLLRGVPCLHVSDGAFCMSLNLGLDNRTLLPPFMPVQRNQDGIFAAVLRAVGGATLFGFLPWLVAHEAPGDRTLPRGETGARTLSGDMILGLVELFDAGLSRGDRENGLVALGKSLSDCARGAARDFEEVVRLLLWRQTSRQIARLEAALQRYESQPDFWARDVLQRIASLRSTMTTPEFIIPRDLEIAFGATAALPCLQRLVQRYGELLQAWPALWKAAGDLRPLARPLQQT